jgi:serine/threonine protein phosphatase 1
MNFPRLRQLFRPHKETVPLHAPHFAVPEGVRVYAVGDIHGRDGLLAKMLATIERDATTCNATKIEQVFLGDYVDRGLHSKGVVDLLLAPPPAGHTRICLMGNHEEALLHFLQDPNILRDWANFGGYATLASYGIPIPDSMSPERLRAVRDRFEQNIPATHLAFFKNLNLRHSVGDYLFVHAGIQPGTSLEKQKPEDLLWIRDSFLKHEGFFNHYIVHGHTPLAAPDVRANRANIDVSSAAKDSLCCLVIEGETRRTMVITDENH